MKLTHRIPWRTPYGYLEVEYEAGEPIDYAKLALEAATMEDTYLATIQQSPAASRQTPPADDAPPPDDPPEYQARPTNSAPHRPQTNSGHGGSRGGASGDSSKRSGLWCPEHDEVELVQTIDKYQEWDDVNGQRVPAKFFCPGDKNGTGKNHSVWRSQALVSESAR